MDSPVVARRPAALSAGPQPCILQCLGGLRTLRTPRGKPRGGLGIGFERFNSPRSEQASSAGSPVGSPRDRNLELQKEKLEKQKQEESQAAKLQQGLRELAKLLMPAPFWTSKDTCGEQITRGALDTTLERLPSSVEPWAEGGFTHVRAIEEAARNFGQVDLMRQNASDNQVAVKRMPKHWVTASPQDFDSAHPDVLEKPWQDVGILRKLNELYFPYACTLLGIYTDSENMYVATSLASIGDVFNFTFATPGRGREREVFVRPLARQALAAVTWLHELGIGHRDISLENMLLEEREGTLRLKVIDYAMITLERPCSGLTGKPSYRAPEMYEGMPYDPFLSDNFALGVSLFTMAVMDYPWLSTKRDECEKFGYIAKHGLRAHMARQKLRSGGNVRLLEAFSEEYVQVVEGLLALQPQARMCLGEAYFESQLSNGQRASARDCPWFSELGKAEG